VVKSTIDEALQDHRNSLDRLVDTVERNFIFSRALTLLTKKESIATEQVSAD